MHFDDDIGPPSWHRIFPLFRKAGGPTLLVGFHLIGTTDEIELPEPVVARLACHALIQQLPDAVLHDALESLNDYYESATPRLPSVMSLPGPQKRPSNARFGGRRVATLPPAIELD
jgi:hypothetical protein